MKMGSQYYTNRIKMYFPTPCQIHKKMNTSHYIKPKNHYPTLQKAKKKKLLHTTKSKEKTQQKGSKEENW